MFGMMLVPLHLGFALDLFLYSLLYNLLSICALVCQTKCTYVGKTYFFSESVLCTEVNQGFSIPV